METINHEPTERTLRLAKDLSNFVNCYNSQDQHDLVKLILNDHPTLQQSTIRLFLILIEAMAEKEYVDGRNKASREVCRMIISAFKRERAEYDSKLHGRPISDAGLPSLYLPYI